MARKPRETTLFKYRPCWLTGTVKCIITSEAIWRAAGSTPSASFRVLSPLFSFPESGSSFLWMGTLRPGRPRTRGLATTRACSCCFRLAWALLGSYGLYFTQDIRLCSPYGPCFPWSLSTFSSSVSSYPPSSGAHVSDRQDPFSVLLRWAHAGCSHIKVHLQPIPHPFLTFARHRPIGRMGLLV
jgi:hypothetical protein